MHALLEHQEHDHEKPPNCPTGRLTRRRLVPLGVIAQRSARACPVHQGEQTRIDGPLHKRAALVGDLHPPSLGGQP